LTPLPPGATDFRMSLASPPRIALLTLLAGVTGALIFNALELPAAWLSGAMVGIVLLMATGFRPSFPDAMRDVGMLLAGCATGSSITPEMIEVLRHYPISLAMLVATTFAVTFGGAAVLRRGFGWDPASAFFASVPGALSAVVASVGEVGGNMAKVIAGQALRLFTMVAILPSIILKAAHVHPVRADHWLEAGPFAVQAFGGLALALLFVRLKVMTPYFLGGMVVAAILHLTRLAAGATPEPVGNLAFLLIGIFAASRMAGTSMAVLRSLWKPCIALLVSSTLIALVGGYLTHVFSGVPVANALIAFAPGGLEAMVALGLALGLDPLYVTSHHVARFVLLSLSVPLLARRL